jgi:hypothetical protein
MVGETILFAIEQLAEIIDMDASTWRIEDGACCDLVASR